MVIKRLPQFSLFFLLILINNVNYAAPQLILYTDKTESIIGRPIRADLYGISLNSKISEINLSNLNENFGIVTDYVINETSDKRWPNQAIQILRLKLYPRRTGKIIIPSFLSNNTYSKEKTLNIIDGNTDTPKITLTPINPYQRQQIIAQFSIISNNPASRLSLNENITVSGFESHPLEFKRTQIKDGKYLLQIGLALSALQSGLLKLELPAIKYSESGVFRKQFYFPIKEVTVKSLPLYLPPTIPVGEVFIKSKITSTSLLKTNSLYYWNINLSGKLINSYQLPAILRQIKSNTNIKFFPVDSMRTNIKTTDNLTSIARHSIPFKVLNSGRENLPAIHFQYFDPATGKINKVIHHTDSFVVLGAFWRSILSVVVVIILIYMLKYIITKWQRFKISKYKRDQALQILNENNADQLKKAIRLIAESECWPYNITIRHWGDLWSDKYQTNNNFEEFITKLNRYFYNEKNNLDSNKLNLELTNLVKNRKTL